MTTAPAISVVIPAHNGLPHLLEQLDALSVQELDHPWEVVVVDNRSTDGTSDAVRTRAASFPVELRVIAAPDRAGAAHARNRGAIAARAELLAFCDADDRVGTGWIAAAVEGLRRFDAVGGPLRELRTPFDPGAPELAYGAVGHGPRGRTILTGNMAMRRDVYLRVGGLDESLPRYGGEDSEFSIRLAENGASIGFAPQMVLYFRSTAAPRERVLKVFLSGVAQYLIWCKHPQVFGTPPSTGALLRRLLTVPLRMIAAYRQHGANRALRDAVMSTAHVWAAIRIGARVPEPILLDRAAVEDSTRRTEAEGEN